ncbi:MAG: cyclic beta 1-2 glucan synthetase [Planctomycetes bacterium]|nr:cyclic beta 1-2 glucan synthetase [Planctomycetota bacterium]
MPLKLGELWAVPIMLRLALIENLRRVAARVASSRRDRDLAADWAERMVLVVEQNPTDLILVMADMARANPPLSGAFLAEMTRHLQGQSPHFAFANSWLAQRMLEQGLTIEQLVQADGQAQAADQVSMGNSIVSLRFLSSNDWRDFVEEHSLVERTLCEDPIYAEMDFTTRDRYRHVVEEIARQSPCAEQDVARKAIQLTRQGSPHAPREDGRHAERDDYIQDQRTSHVGYYLIDNGRSVLEKNAGVRLPLWTRMSRIIGYVPLFAYLSGALLISAMVSAAFLTWAIWRDAGPIALCLLALPFVFCAAHLGVGMVNWLAILLVHPRSLPRLDFSAGIPAEHRTMVVVPTMLSNPEAIAELLEGLEVRYLSNRDDKLHFALLTDYLDAPQEVMPQDAELVRLAKEGIELLNQKYENDRVNIFYFFHRPRRWNATEKVWMGYERKRGKLAELNALLRDSPAQDDSAVGQAFQPDSQAGKPDLQSGKEGRFAEVVGDLTVLSEVRYVITLDTDTQLPRDSARQMVGAMAHPLNRPVLDLERRRVVAGYGIMQPRVGVSLPTAQRSWFVRLFAGDAGVDPYTRVVSDLYQDLFGEGSFVGKGIYDVDAFEQCCGNFPENAILSHDLLESTYVRSALLSDVELYEEFPSRYPADVSRRHRWMRGDWQIAWWLMPWVPELAGRASDGTLTDPSLARPANWVRNPIGALSAWKVFDNLRRSLVPVAMMSVLLLSWLLLEPALAASATLFVLAVIGAVPLLAALSDLVRKPIDLPVFPHLSATVSTMGKQSVQFLCTFVFLPFEALISADAIVRTVTRMLWTKTKMLEWKTASDASLGASTDLASFIQSMWFGPALGATALFLLAFWEPPMLVVAGPLLVLWLVSPGVAWWLSRTLSAPPIRLSELQRDFLHKLSRRTWRYFEVFVTAEENWLPPDNFQEKLADGIASRTSPTNIGVALLADLAACDFGYCSAGRMLDRMRKTFATLARMERHRGHFYNWYNTRSLKPLFPLYVSTVDSGNLAGHLLVLRSGMLELIETRLLRPRIFGGLRDTACVLLDVARGFHRTEQQTRAPLAPFDVLQKIERVIGELENCPETLSASLAMLQRLGAAAAEIVSVAGENEELQWWASALERSCADHRADLLTIAAWLPLSPPPECLQRLDGFRTLWARLEAAPSMREVGGFQQSVLPTIDALMKDVVGQAFQPDSQAGKPDLPDAAWLGQLQRAISDSSQRAADRIKVLEHLASQCQEFADMDFAFLFDESRDLFAIGYNVGDQRLDNSFYDLLASESRLASYVLIAQGQVRQEHWFALGRMLTSAGGATTLLSWSGSMFEYLMPLLVMPTYKATLLDQTCRAAVRRQIAYGKQRDVPWGISESGYNTIDAHMNYQYRAFGVPGLGLKRGLAEDLVIAPYASVLALMVAPEAACANLERLTAEGHAGAYGLYEAVDYTPSRLPSGTTSVNVRQFMAHHEGMSLLALAFLLLDKPMQRRFEADPMLRAADLLLQERVPRAVAPIFPHVAEASVTRSISAEADGAMRVFTDPNGPVPEVHLLSNGRYHVVITSAGGGYSRWRDLAVTRWREDATRDCFGTFCYLRDLDSGALWSTAWQPTLKAAKRYQAIFTQSRAEFRRSDDRIDTHTEISVSPEDDIELRRISITNRSKGPRTIELTSYAEVVLALPAQDLSHPAFSNLFVQTELVNPLSGAGRQAIVCTRRPRSAEEKPPWMMHLMTVQGTTIGEASFETDRMRFIGRGRTLADPVCMDHPLAGRASDGINRSSLARSANELATSLSNSEGPVLDPVVCIRRVIVLQPHETMRIDLVTGVAETREAVMAMTQKYSDPRLTDRVFELTWTHSQILLRQLNASEADAQGYGRLAGSIIYASSLRRAKASMLIRNRRGQSGLWGYGISGDLPIVLVRIRDNTRIELVRQAVQAHAYWRMKGVAVDLVVWNEDDSVYRQTLQDTIMDLVAASPEAALVDKPGGIFVRRGEQMSEEDRALMQTVARVILVDDAGTLHDQIERRGRTELSIPILKPTRRRPETRSLIPLGNVADTPRRDLAFFNGLGGFSRDGREFVMLLGPGQTTPAPWVNVIANPQFGTVVSESGCAYTWAENSHEFRLTPWHNDPVTDASGEAIYLRDEETGHFWSPTPLPARGQNSYVARHGFGYSMFEHTEDGIVTELSIYVATDAPVKFARLKITNRSGRQRELSVTGYWEFVLGELRDKSLMHVVTELDPVSGALFARNPFSNEFADRVVFVDASETHRTFTGDRTEFLGRNGTPANPAAMRRVRLSGRVGAGLDPCAAMQVAASLDEGQEKEIVFILGAAGNENEARQLVLRFRGADRGLVGNAYRALEGVWHYWSRTLGAVYVETPDVALNFLANGWLLYQTLACRMWARTGFYQSGGAFGFRDQLQDAMALVHAEPGLLREQLLRAASRQFREGDVQHWWHPPVGRGVRTHFSDDYLWLPYATARYVTTTGDTGVFDECVPFLRSRTLRPDEEANYDLPQISDDVGTLYEHCIRALDRALPSPSGRGVGGEGGLGSHGLPLMGCGDWNDGMNLVGQHGKGESVWLAFFLYDVLMQFVDLARERGDVSNVDKFTLEAGRLRGNIDEHGWDGEWYRRAYFDDGTPLGSAVNSECQIDSISQSWSILSGAGTDGRIKQAMENLDRRLVREDARLIQLLDPPFDKSELNPGYIKGYVPGVRENGGQYTHAAIWTVMAFAAAGDAKRAWELFALINPVTHAENPEAVARYRVEPFVMAADVYAVPPHTGRGGWTWYTGSAGWMYRLITESLLGLRLDVDKLRFAPCLPTAWASFKIHYRYRETAYHITVRTKGAGSAVTRILLDGYEQPEIHVPLVDDRKEHHAEVEIG